MVPVPCFDGIGSVSNRFYAAKTENKKRQRDCGGKIARNRRFFHEESRAEDCIGRPRRQRYLTAAVSSAASRAPTSKLKSFPPQRLDVSVVPCGLTCIPVFTSDLQPTTNAVSQLVTSVLYKHASQ